MSVDLGAFDCSISVSLVNTVSTMSSRTQGVMDWKCSARGVWRLIGASYGRGEGVMINRSRFRVVQFKPLDVVGIYIYISPFLIMNLEMLHLFICEAGSL